MNRKEEISASYKILGKSGKIYDSILLRSTPAGRIMNTLMWGFTKETTLEWIEGWQCGIPEGFEGKILEVPVGTGVLTMPVYKNIPNADITCLDYSEDMMGNARSRAAEMGIGNITFKQGDVGNLPFEDETFDLLLSLNGFHAFPDKEAAYRETHRVLKKGGIFCGCFYTEGESKRTDWVAKHLFVPKGSFTPPFETPKSLKDRLEAMYEIESFKSVRAISTFVCHRIL